jgi:hypothetical protein
LNSKLDFNGVPPSKIVQIHEVTRETLKILDGDMEKKNAIRKGKIKELESVAMPPPLFSSPISIIQPWKCLEGRLEYSSKLKGKSSLLPAIRIYVIENIQKRMHLILDKWELTTSFVSLG